MRTVDILVRFANSSDLALVSSDGFLSAEIIARKIERREVLVAESGGCLVAYARFEFLWSRLPYLTLIQVLPGHQRVGVGRSILKYLETYLQAKGYTVLYSSSQADEPGPQAWHRRLGFTECGRIAEMNPGGADEVFFRKSLVPSLEP